MFKCIRQLQTMCDITPGRIYPGLNALKGILVILVIFTHALPGSMLLYFFYMFHMPAFLSVSGYLLKRSAFENGLRKYFKRAAQRLLIPWAIASIIYLPFSLQGRSLSRLTMTDLLYPFFHLWYVPAYFIGVMLCYAVAQLRIPVRLVLFITASFTLVWYILFRDSHLPVTEQPLYWLGEKRFYAYLFFFFLGFALRNQYVKTFPHPIFLLSVITVVFAAIVYCIFKNLSDLVIAIPYLIFNIGLILFLLLYVGPQNWFQNKFILLVNRQSLGVYLYHPLVMFAIYRIIGDPQKQHVSNLEGLGVGVITVIVTVSLIWLIKKWDLANRYLFGINESKGPEIKETLIALPYT
jgi:fucose 4-O-acetylase-like acetyltransferase